jgi:voltage-gated sodium channel
VDGLAVSPWALPYYISYVFVIVFTILNVLIGVVLNAMDEARQESRDREDEIKRLQNFAKEVDDISADGMVSTEELTQLREKISQLEKEIRRAKKD